MSEDLQSGAHSKGEFRVEGTRLVVTVSGTFNIGDSIKRFEAVIAACRMQNLTEVLIDTRQVTGQGTVLPVIIYAMQTAALYRSHLLQGGAPFRTAQVATEILAGGWSEEAQAVVLDGMDLFVTDDMDAALAWLDD